MGGPAANWPLAQARPRTSGAGPRCIIARKYYQATRLGCNGAQRPPVVRQLGALCWRQSRSWLGRCAALKKRTETKRPSSSSAGHPGAIISAQSPFVCPVLDPGERSCLSEKRIINAQALPSKALSLINTPGRPALALALFFFPAP
jgi:hypothetical protein